MEDYRDCKKSSNNYHHTHNGVVTNTYQHMEKERRDNTSANNDNKHIRHRSNERKYNNQHDTTRQLHSRHNPLRSTYNPDVQGYNQHKPVKKHYADNRDKSRSRVKRNRSRSRDRFESKYERRREHRHGEHEYTRRNRYREDVKRSPARHRTKYTKPNNSISRYRSGSNCRDRVISKNRDRHHRDHILGRKHSDRRVDHRHSKDRKKNRIVSKDKSPSKRRDRKKAYYASASSSSSSSKSSEKDLDHYKYKIGTVLNEKYKIEQFLGDGTFGRVLECRNIHDNESYAVKVIRPVKRYIESAKIEAETIIDIIAKDVNRESNCVLMIDYFYFEDQNNRYIALVFEKLGKSLYDFIKMNNYKGFPMHIVQTFAKQILHGIGFLHDKLQLTHTDLKPENLLFKNSTYDVIKSKKLWPKHVLHKESRNRSASPSTRSYSKDPNEKDEPYYIPVNPNIKIIDFGGATYKTERHSEIINTRQYRSPEVILGSCEWDEKSDIWSIACILAELYTGELFFPTHNNEEHLCLIEKASGCIPHWMADNCKKEFAKIFYSDKTDSEINKLGHRINFSKLSKREEKLDAVREYEILDDLILDEHLIFRQFLKSLLIIDPTERPSCKESLKHEFFKFDFNKDKKEEDK